MIDDKFIPLLALPFTPLARPARLITIFFFACVAGASVFNKTYAATVKEPKAMSAQNTYESLLTSSGTAYLENEKIFLTSDNEALKFLQTNYRSDDPLNPVIGRVLLEWKEGLSPENNAALSYLDNLPNAIKNTPIPTPSPTGAVHYLKVNFQKKAAGIFAVRLAKQTPMPHWRLMATLFYLEYCAMDELNPALIRFINTTENDEWRKEALKILLSTQDPQIKEKIKAEEIWLKSQNSSLNDALRALLTVP